eukprot:COSAG06_NODE_4533_length_4170_cov_1.684353_3_plen_150_part_00
MRRALHGCRSGQHSLLLSLLLLLHLQPLLLLSFFSCKLLYAPLCHNQVDEFLIGLVTVASVLDSIFADANICSACAQLFQAERAEFHLFQLVCRDSGPTPSSLRRSRNRRTRDKSGVRQLIQLGGGDPRPLLLVDRCGMGVLLLYLPCR